MAVAGLGAGALLAPGVAQAGDTCYSGGFCWYTYYNQTGGRGSVTQYSGWIGMSSHVDNTASSYNAQTYDGDCQNNGQPVVQLADTYYDRKWISTVATYSGQAQNTFNTIYVYDTGLGYGYQKNMVQLFNLVQNIC
ncbi:hypothetical protein [Longispora urticae]